jgi:DNA mismatch repair ATPase MutS
MIKNIKEIHPKTLLLFKVGAFCESYGKDAYILSYLFNYQINQKGKNNISKIGFSKKSISKVLSKLEEQKIDYLLIDVRTFKNIKILSKQVENFIFTASTKCDINRDNLFSTFGAFKFISKNLNTKNFTLN